MSQATAESFSTSWAMSVAWERDFASDVKFILVAIASGYRREDIAARTGLSVPSVHQAIALLWVAAESDPDLKRIMVGRLG